MTQEQRHIYYDTHLKIEAYHLTGIVQPFPNHFHDYYVIGFIEGGGRHLLCKNLEYQIRSGDLLLFNPKDSHCCAPLKGKLLDYRAINIPSDTMKQAVKEITGQSYTVFFTENVVYQSDATAALRNLYSSIVDQAPDFEKEENFYFLLEQILRAHSTPFEALNPTLPDDVIQSLWMN